MSSRNLHWTRGRVGTAVTLTAVVASTFAVRAELPEWIRNVPSASLGASRWHDAIFRTVPTAAGPVEVRRSPADAHDMLTKAGAAAADVQLFALRARVAEEKLDQAAAEADWKAYASASPDRVVGQLALADFYHRRLLPQQEADALAAAAGADDTPADRLLAETERRSWRIFERLFALIDAQQLPDAFAEAQTRAWLARFPKQQAPYDRLFRFLVERERTTDAEALLADYQRAFPSDDSWVLKGRAALATERGATADALAVYDRAFRPLWDTALVQEYFALLERTHTLRAFLDRARADVAARPADITPVARIFYYYQRSGNVTAAEHVLSEFEARREKMPRTADELFTLAGLYERTRNYNEALRYYASIYSLPGASAADVEQALVRIIDTLLTAPEQPLRFGSSDLSFYRDIATLDRGPGFLNGVLSLLFNSVSPSHEYAQQEASATSYFHRARATDLVGILETRFPKSTHRARLNATLVATYAAYGASDAVIDRGRRFLATFPDAPERTAVTLAMADAFARRDLIAEEFAAYDRLLQELATRADRVPLGAGTAYPGFDSHARATGARAHEYARVLDRYIARLIAREQPAEALAVYRRELERNPNDPGLYAATAQFLEQNNLAAQVEQIYRLAIQQFPDPSWHHRLARWYLRRQQAAAFEGLTRDVTRTFEGTELARYFDAVVSSGPPVSAQLYLQLNLYAYERFPHHLVFVRNLLSAYSRKETWNPAAWEALLRRHWFEDEALANMFFAQLSRSNRLDPEIAAMRSVASSATAANWSRLAKEHPLAARFLAEADIWRSRFESGTPILSALAAEYPSDVALNQRAGSLHRSLSYVDARETDAAAQAFARLNQYEPRGAATLTALGEIYADRERYEDARAHWNRLPDIEPGNPAGYLEAATVFWDYYQFDDALRIIAQGRTRLRNPTLYAYEAGAIHEGLRQPERAVNEYMRGALAGESSSPAWNRLLRLARRPAYRDLVDRASATATDGTTAGAAAVALRIAVLESQERRDDIERYLATLLDRTSSLEVMIDVGSHAERLGFEAVRTRALARQIESMSDPVEKLKLRYALVRLYESRGERDAARKAVEALYVEHPRVLGIVRQTADFYWRQEQYREAIAVLTRAAAQSYPALRKQFTYEAALKSTTIADYAGARELLQPLLADDPFNADYLAAVADTYARAGDDRALRDFYASRIEAMRAASLPVEERTRRIAGLRRGLIPALARLNDHAGAIDQYIEVINRYPDDEALLLEAGRYARRHSRSAQLVSYYTKTATDSPRDYRWPMLLAKLHTQFEDYPAAIAAYGKAAAIRPDRSDFQVARAGLEERLMRFDDAVASYTRTYELTYRDPQWMEKIAELHARRGRVNEASQALRAALIEGRPPQPQMFFEAARRLELWRMPEAAKTFVDEGVRIAKPNDLLQDGAHVSVYTTMRQAPAVVDRLLAARAAATSTLEPDDDDEDDESTPEGALSRRLNQLADLVDRLFSPEEKAAFASALDAKKATLSDDDFVRFLVPLAERARLLDLAVRWRTELMLAHRDDVPNEHVERLVELQTSRLRFAELATELERFADAGARSGFTVRHHAADAYRRSGDVAGEFRMLSKIPVRALGGSHRERYFTLLLERNPHQLVALAAAEVPDVRNAAANFLVANGSFQQAILGVTARGQGLPPVWTHAYTALVGLHFSRFDTPTTTAFTNALGGATVAERLKPVDRSLQLAGDTWFAYASRFGEFRAFGKQPGAADYLPAPIERTPARSDAYVALADFHRDTGAAASALAEYDHAATLNPDRSDVHLRAAAILWRQERRPEAIERWKQAMNLLAAQAARTAGETEPLEAVLESIAVRKLLPELREPADKMVRAYVARNGTYRAEGLLRAAFLAANDPTAGIEWLLDLARAAPSEAETLATIARAAWLPDGLRDRVYERIVAITAEAVAREYGVAREAKEGELGTLRLERIRSLIDTKQAARAVEVFHALPDEVRRAADGTVVELETRIAAATGALDAVLERYSRDDVSYIHLDSLHNAATAVRRAGDEASARRILEFVYTRKIDNGELTAPVFLGLAEIRLQQGDVATALALLRRLTLVAGEPFEHLAASAALLERLDRPVEALEFRRARVQAVPWDGEAQVALARTEIAAGENRDAGLERLWRVAESPKETYPLRVEAALAFASAGGRHPLPAQTEIDWLRALPDLTPAAVDRPMFVAARLAAAERATEPSVRIALLREAVAVDRDDLNLRVPLFRASLAAGRPADALEALRPALSQEELLTNLGLSASARSQLAREVGEAYQKVDRLQDAVRFLTLAAEGQPAEIRGPIEQRIRTIDAEIGRRRENARRRPHISESLDQPQLVRPRIVARAAARGGAR